MKQALSFLLVLVFLLSAKPQAVAQNKTETFSIPEFVAIEEQWEDFVGKSLKIQGRYSSFIRTGMRFEKCDLNCQFVEQIDRPLGRSRHVEVIGTLEKVAGKLVLNVRSLTTLDDQTTRFSIRKRALAEHDLKRRWELVDWGLKRGTFYNDGELKRMAHQLALEIAAFERSQLGFQTESFQDQLIKLKQFDIPASQLAPLYFEWFAQKALQSDLSLQQAHQLRSEVLTHLPGAELPLKTKPKQQLPPVWGLSTAGQKTAEYKRAQTQAEKQFLARQFHRMIVHRLILPMTSRKTPGEIAEFSNWLEQQLPEETELIKQLRTQALETKLSLIGTATRNELEKLVEEYKQSGQKELAQTAIDIWLTQQRQSIDQRDVVRRLQLVDDYLRLANDRQTSEALLLEIAQQHPTNQELTRRMQSRNFLFVDGQWREKQALSAEEEQIAQAMRHGLATQGMTAEQVKRSMGAPTTVTRILTRGGQQLTWYYEDAGTMVLLNTEGKQIVVTKVLAIPE